MNPMLIPMWLMTVIVGNVATAIAMFVPPEESDPKEGAPILHLVPRPKPI